MSTSKFIETIQRSLAEYRKSLLETQKSLEESEARNQTLKAENRSLVEKLSNAKYEAEMCATILARNQRRMQADKSSYEALVLAHKEYKQTMTDKLNRLETQLIEFVKTTANSMAPDITEPYQVLAASNDKLKEVYEQRQKQVDRVLTQLVVALSDR